jgi:hypothetical protein
LAVLTARPHALASTPRVCAFYIICVRVKELTNQPTKAISKKGGPLRKGTKKVSVPLFNHSGMLSYFTIADNVTELGSCYWHLTALSSQGTQRANRVICKLAGDADYQRQLRLYCGLNSDITNVCNGCRSNFESHVRGLGAGACSNQGRAAVA